MIITEDDSGPRSPVKDSDTTPLLRGADTRSSPPAYSPRRGTDVPGPSHPADHHVHRPRDPTARRFCRAFLVAFGIWGLTFVLLGSILFSIGAIRSRWRYPTIPGVTMDCMEPSREAEKKNPMAAPFPYSVSFEFGVPLPPESLLALSSGSLSAGTFKISTAYLDLEMALLEVTLHYFDKDIRDKAKICLASRKEGEWGLGLLTPRSWRTPSRTQGLFFEVVLSLPRSNSSLYVNRLATDLVNFEQSLDPLNDLAHFGTLSLKGSNGGIHVNTVKADKVKLTTTNGAVSANHLVSRSTKVITSNRGISGTFTATDSVDLRTSNAPISVDVRLDAGNSSEIKNVTLKTSNDNLQSSIHLTTPSNNNGSFRVEQETSNGQLMAKIVSLPVDAMLDVTATTSSAPVGLHLPSTYEGDLKVVASSLSARRVDPLEPDPAGRGRTRTFQTWLIRLTKMDASVFWDAENMHRGRAIAKAINGLATVYF